jgi:hypothetical protein
MAFFYNFPKINYFNKETRNIIVKAAIIKQVLNQLDAFHPYIIRDYERPDTIAFDQYNDENLDWVIYFANDIMDPYYDWPLFPGPFESYLEKKYNASVYDLMSQVDHYEYTGLDTDTPEYISRITWHMSPDTYTYTADTSGWTSVSVYDYETRLNDQKRSIKLLNRFYIPQIKRELRDIFN